MWVGDDSHNFVYHAIEDVYAGLRDFLAEAKLIHREIQPEYAWWLMGSDHQWLVAMVAFEDGPDAPVDVPGIDLAGRVGAGARRLQRYDFSGRPAGEWIDSDRRIPAITLSPRGFALFRIW